MRVKPSLFFVAALLCASLLASQARAIVLYDQQFRHKSAPSGTIANSGWQWEGNWGSFTGTPIGKNYFVTASHVGGSVGQSLSLNGVSYPTVAMYDDPNSDLRIWKTTKSFSSWAPLYTSTGEIGKTAVLFGRGATRGSAISVNSSTHGWLWGTQDGALSWGRNKLAKTVDGGSGLGNFLAYSFSRNGRNDYVTDEGTTSAGDSSGAVFVNSYGVWKLAGINYSIEGPFSKTAGGSTFLGSVFDKGGLYTQGVFNADGSTDLPALAYASRISTNQNWIKSIIGTSAAALPSTALVPEPTSMTLLLAGATALLAKRRRRD